MSESSNEKEQRGERRVAQNRQNPNETDLASKLLHIQYKRFYVDVKNNTRGRFIKIAEMGSNHKSRITLSMSAAVALIEKLELLKKFSDEQPEEKIDKDVELKSESLNYDTRRYYLDLKQNSRGRFLRIAQTVTIATPRMVRSQVVIPGEGLAELITTLHEFVDKFAEGFLDHQLPASGLPEAKQIRSENGKMFYFDAGSNDRGSFIRITEVKQGNHFRTAITVPSKSLVKFRDAINEIIEKFDETPSVENTPEN